MRLSRSGQNKACIWCLSLSVFGSAPEMAFAQVAVEPAGTTTVVDAVGAGATTPLTVDSGSTYVIDFANTQSLVIKGDLNNSGTIYAISSNPQVTTATISANNIYNFQSGLISTILPPSLSNFSSAVSNLNLVLSAINNIVNQGAITSAGSLNMLAGNTITNALPAGLSGPSPVMMAMQNLTMQAQNIINSGQIISQLGSIDSYMSNFNNTLGTVSALNGNLSMQNLVGSTLSIENSMGVMAARERMTIRALDAVLTDSGSNGTQALLSVIGGDLTASSILFDSPGGAVRVDVGSITGEVTLDSGDAAGIVPVSEASITVAAGDLTLGRMCLDGDPTFYNSGGNINLTGDLIFPGEALAVVASGNIITTNDGIVISTSSDAVDGGNILILAGVSIAPGGASLPPSSATTGIFILGPSVTGGDIDFATNPLQFITSASTIDGGNGGNITLGAYNGTALGAMTGSILMPTIPTLPGAFGIFAGGTGAGSNGDVTAVAGAPAGTTLVVSPINAGVGTGGGGNVLLVAGVPVLAGAGFVNLNGELDGYLSWTTTQADGIVSISSINTAASLTVAGGGIDILKSLILQSSPASNNIALLSSGNITAQSGSFIQSNGGALTAVAGANFSNDPNTNTTTVLGASAGGGNIDFSDSLFVSTAFLPSVSAPDGNGGDIVLITFAGPLSAGSIVTPQDTGPERGIFSGGTIQNGSITAIAGSDSIAIDAGQINAGVGANGGGDVTLVAGDPVMPGGPVTLNNAAISSGKFSWTTVNPTATVQVGSVNTADSLTVAAGSIALSGSGIFLNAAGGQNNLALLASGSINAVSPLKIRTNGGDILAVAGADMLNDPLSDTTSVLGASPFGGSLLLGQLETLSSNRIGSPGDGGDITLVAFAGVTPGSGSIVGPQGAGPQMGIFTGGNDGGVNGNLTAIAGGIAGVTLDLSSINTGTSTGGGGAVLLAAANPVVAPGAVTIQNGQIIGPNHFSWNTVNPNATIHLGTVNTAGSITAVGGSIVLTGAAEYPAGFAGLFLNSPASNNIVLLASADIDVLPGVQVQAASGDVLMVAGADFSNNPVSNLITLTGASLTGGDLNLSGLGTLSTSSTVASADGGNVDLVAYAGAAAGGHITLPTSVGIGIFTLGSGAGTDGNVSIIANGTGDTITTGYINAGSGNVLIAGAEPTSALPISINQATILTGNFSFLAVDELTTVKVGTVNSAGNLTVAAGNIVVTGAGAAPAEMGLFIDGSGLALLASEDIEVLPQVALQTVGDPIVLVSGAVVVNDQLTEVTTVTGASATGGNIDLSLARFVSSAGLVGDTNGGDINLIAFDGAITTPTGSGSGLYSVASGNGVNGDIRVIAGGTGTAITTGLIDAAGSLTATGGGSLLVAAAQPALAGGSVDITNGAISSGSFSWTTATPGGTVELGTVNSASDLTAVGGNIVLTGAGGLVDGVFLNSPVGSNAAAFIAVQDIEAMPGVTVQTNGGDILLVAGADFENDPLTDTITVAGGSAQGGSVDFGDAVAVSAARTQGTGEGGDVTMVAFAGNSSGGRVTTPLSTGSGQGVFTGGMQAASGDVRIIAGADSGVGVTTGLINASDGQGNSGDILIATAQPVTVGSTAIQNGALISGKFSWSLPESGAQANIGTVNTADTMTVAAGSILLTGTGAVAGQQGIFLADPALALIASTNITALPGIAVQTKGGSILMVAGAQFSNDPLTETISITGPVSTGSIDFSQAAFISASPFAGGSDGGVINLISYDGSVLTPVNSGSGVFASGIGTGTNGQVSIIAGGASGSTVLTGLIDTGTGAAGGGEIRIVTGNPVSSTGGPVQVQNAALLPGNSFSWQTLETGAVAEIGTINRTDKLFIAAGSILLTGTGGTGTASGVFLTNTPLPGANSIVMISTGNIESSAGAVAIQTSGGSIHLLAGANALNDPMTDSLLSLTQSLTGGFIDLTESKFVSTAEPGALAGGAPVTMAAYVGSGPGAGDIRVPSLLTGGGDLALIAGRSITAGVGPGPAIPAGADLLSPPIHIQTNGGNVLFVAGTQFSNSLADPGAISISGGNAVGGFVDLSNVASINAASTNSDGGDISIVAFAGSSALSGTINVTNMYSGANVTSGSGGTSGSMNLIAGALSGLAVSISGVLNAHSGSDGEIAIAAATPLVTGGPMTINPDGTYGGGQLTWQNPTQADVTINTVNSADCLTVVARDITITGFLALNGQLPADNFLALLAGRDILAPNSGGFIQTLGGDIVIVAGVDVNQSGNVINVNGGSTSGGDIDLANMLFVSSAFVEPSVANGDGGNINLIAYAGTGGGTISLPLTPDDSISTGVFSGGKGTGSNGNVTIIAGGSTGTTISLGDINSTGGTVGTGDVLIAAATPLIQVPTQIADCELTGGWTAGQMQNDAIIVVGDICCTGDVTIIGTTEGETINAVGNIIITVPGNYTVDMDLITTNGLISINSTRGSLLVEDGILLSASLDVNLSAFKDVQVGKTGSGASPVNISAGTLSDAGVIKIATFFAGTNPINSITPNDIDTIGNVNITSTTGSVLLRKEVTIQSVGGSINMQAGDALSVEEGSHLQALGGYITGVAAKHPDAKQGSVLHIHKSCCWLSLALVTPNDVSGGGIGLFSGNFTPAAIAAFLDSNRGNTATNPPPPVLPAGQFVQGHVVFAQGSLPDDFLENPNTGYIQLTTSTNDDTLRTQEGTLYIADGGIIMASLTREGLQETLQLDQDGRMFAIGPVGGNTTIAASTYERLINCGFEVIIPPAPVCPEPPPLVAAIPPTFIVTPQAPEAVTLPPASPTPTPPPVPPVFAEKPGAPPVPLQPPPIPPEVIPPPGEFPPPFINPSNPPPPPNPPEPPIPPPPPPTPPAAAPVTGVTVLPAPDQPPTPVALPPLPTIIVNQCQAFFVNDKKESYLQATDGTKLAVTHNNQIAMQNGQMILRTGAESITVTATAADIELAPSSVALIGAGPGEPTTITALDAAGPAGVSVRVGGTAYQLVPGEKLMISSSAERAAVSSPFAPIANVTPSDSATLEGGIQVNENLFVLRAAANLPESIPKLVFLQCRECTFRNYLKAKFEQTFGAVATADYASAPDIVGSDLVAVGTGHYKLNSGNVLIRADRRVRVDMPYLSVSANKNAVLLLTANSQVTRVRDITDNAANDVVVQMDNRVLPLSPGKELAVSDLRMKPMSAIFSDDFARRNIRETNYKGLTVVTSEFSLVDALNKHPLLMRLKGSGASTDRRMMSSLMKTAAAINLVIDRSAGPYYEPKIHHSTGLAVTPKERIY